MKRVIHNKRRKTQNKNHSKLSTSILTLRKYKKIDVLSIISIELPRILKFFKLSILYETVFSYFLLCNRI